MNEFSIQKGDKTETQYFLLSRIANISSLAWPFRLRGLFLRLSGSSGLIFILVHGRNLLSSRGSWALCFLLLRSKVLHLVLVCDGLCRWPFLSSISVSVNLGEHASALESTFQLAEAFGLCVQVLVDLELREGVLVDKVAVLRLNVDGLTEEGHDGGADEEGAANHLDVSKFSSCLANASGKFIIIQFNSRRLGLSSQSDCNLPIAAKSLLDQ